jgi:hypothetical protein
MWTTSSVHHAIMQSFVEHGRPPMLPVEAHPALHELAAEHGVVLHPGSTEIWAAHPFSASPTAIWVEAGERGWWAPCVWCALGITVLAAPTSTIHARYGGEAEPMTIEVVGGVLATAALVHFAIPARDAWTNVIHWCSTVLPFRTRDDVPRWSRRHGLPSGVVVDLAQVHELARVWYGGHLRRDWRKHTAREAQDIFARVGLVGPHWELPTGEDRF